MKATFRELFCAAWSTAGSAQEAYEVLKGLRPQVTPASLARRARRYRLAGVVLPRLLGERADEKHAGLRRLLAVDARPV